MLTVLINGSPKLKGSASGMILGDLKKILDGKTEMEEVDFHTNIVNPEAMETLKKADKIVVAFPLYFDGIPSHLLRCLEQIKDISADVYAVSNAGFYEGEQNAHALAIIRNWCSKNNPEWKMGVGIGGGGAMTAIGSVPLGKGPKKGPDKALMTLADQLVKGQGDEDIFVSIGMPRRMYKMAAEMGWKSMAKKNGLKKEDLEARK